MQVGFASLVGVEPLPFPELLRRAASHGLETIEVNVGPGYPRIAGADYPGHLDLRAIVEQGPGPVHELLDAHGLTISALAPMLNLLTPDPRLREERIAALRLAIDACAALGVGTLVTYAGSAFGMHFWDRLFAAVPSPALGLSFDPSHLVWLHVPDIPGVIRRYAPRIYHVDAKDA